LKGDGGGAGGRDECEATAGKLGAAEELRDGEGSDRRSEDSAASQLGLSNWGGWPESLFHFQLREKILPPHSEMAICSYSVFLSLERPQILVEPQ
jgi:hypothetical protein